MVRCRVSHIIFDETTDSQTVYLAETEGRRHLGILIGPMEAIAIDRAVKQQPFQRPLTHDLASTALRRLGAELAAVRITEAREGTYYAETIVRDRDGGEHILDSRPSDALALAVRHPGCAIEVADDLLED